MTRAVQRASDESDFASPTKQKNNVVSPLPYSSTPVKIDRRIRKPMNTPQHFSSLVGETSCVNESADLLAGPDIQSHGSYSLPGKESEEIDMSDTRVARKRRKKNISSDHPNVGADHPLHPPTQTWNDNVIDFGLPECACPYCGAMFWYAERLERHRNTTMPIFSLCCNHDKVSIPLLKHTPSFLDNLLDVNGGPDAKHFRKEVRPYNAMFSMSSTGAKLDRRVTNSSGPYSFVICGANYHHMGSLLPPEGRKARFSQLYVFDTDDEVGDRLSNFSSTNLALRPHIVDGLIKMFDQTNELVKTFRRVAREVQDPANHNLRLRIAGNREEGNRQYDLPTGTDIAGLIPGDFNAEDGDRDIIINHRAEGLQRIVSLNPKFHALQFPVLFPYGEDGFHLGIKCNQIHSSTNAKRKNVTEREFHAFRLQHRQSEGQSLM
ncbi:unnamed protein product [Linum trigynum]|uniref:Helitron helicase-like domain-containing protein n=1 Tax=Linum trigynum TaxID=586398 RepID=A0AAV2CMU0_9ROSI